MKRLQLISDCVQNTVNARSEVGLDNRIQGSVNTRTQIGLDVQNVQNAPTLIHLEDDNVCARITCKVAERFGYEAQHEPLGAPFLAYIAGCLDYFDVRNGEGLDALLSKFPGMGYHDFEADQRNHYLRGLKDGVKGLPDVIISDMQPIPPTNDWSVEERKEYGAFDLDRGTPALLALMLKNAAPELYQKMIFLTANISEYDDGVSESTGVSMIQKMIIKL